MGIYTFQRDDAWTVASALGEDTKVKGSELQFKLCPYCHGGKNRDKNTFAINLTTGLFNCKRASCGAHGNMVTLARDFDLSLGRDFDDYYNIKPGRFRTIGKKLTEEDVTPTALDYLKGRCIAEEVILRYHITTQKERTHILVFPFYEPDGKRISFVKYRNTQPKPGENKEWCEAGCKPILFGMEQCDPDDKTLIMTEGQIDTLSVVTAGYKNCVSVPLGKNGFTWVPHCWDWLQSFDKLIIFGDYEDGSMSLLEPMTKRFNKQLFHVRFEDYQDCKDANDILRKYGAEGIRRCIENAEPVLDPNIVPLWEVKPRDLSEIECISTGFKKLDAIIGGLCMGHLMIITGERGNGKSTFASQLLAVALRAGKSIYAYSGELPAETFKRWLDRQLCSGNGLESRTINGRTDYYVAKGEEEALNRWYKDRAYLYCGDNLPDEGHEQQSILQSVERAIQRQGVQVILIDNLMSAIEDPGPDLNQTQTNFVAQLAKMARYYEVAIILLVHPRKSSYQGRELTNDDIMGSGNITNLASVVLAYSPRPQEGFYGDAERLISVLKNRLYGDRAVGIDAIRTWFDPPTKRITEEKGNFRWESDEESKFVESDEHDSELPF